MKLLLAVLLCSSVGFAQVVTGPTFKYDFVKTKGGTSVLNKAYTGTTLDTTQALGLAAWTNNFVNVSSADSASVTIKYQLSVDGVNWGVLTTADSLSTASNTGDVKSVNLSTYAVGSPFIRFIFALNPSFRLGTSSATYSASLMQKR